jgi:hypothetical protein
MWAEFMTPQALEITMICVKGGAIILAILGAVKGYGVFVGKFDSLNLRFDAIDQRFTALNKKIDDGFSAHDKRFDKIDNEILILRSDLKDTNKELVKINEKVSCIASDVARLEGAFEERGKWESKQSVGL